MTKEEIEHEKLWTEGIVSAVMLSSKGIVSDFISNLEKVGYKIVKAESENERLKAEREWISVETELPTHFQDILFIPLPIGSGIKHGIFLENDEWNRSNMFYGSLGYFELYKVTYWMPFPELPKPSKQ